MDAFYRAKEKSVNYHEKIIHAFTALSALGIRFYCVFFFIKQKYFFSLHHHVLLTNINLALLHVYLMHQSNTYALRL